MVALSDEQLKAKTAEFQQRRQRAKRSTNCCPEAFAVVREAGKRVMGMRHFDVQLIGGMTLHDGKIAEMRTGEARPWWAPCRSTSTRCPARACTWSR